MDDHKARQTKPNHSETTPTNSSTDTTTILIVEDDEDIAALYMDWLGDYTLKAVTSGERALEVIDEAVDIVVLDRQLPGIGGEKVLETLREREVACQVIVASGVTPDLDLVRMEFDAYLVKPISKDELRAAVRHALTRVSYDRKLREFYALSEKRAVLREQKSDQELAASEEYATLLERLQALSEQLDTIAMTIERTATDGENAPDDDI